MNIKELKTLVENYNKTLKADDKRFRRTVHINTLDGSNFTIDSAFLMTLNDKGSRIDGDNPDMKWIIVFAEHYNYQYFHESDLSFWAQYERIYDIESL